MDALLPCPFCGGTAELADIGNWHTKSRATEVQCTGCKVKKRFAAIRQGHEKTREWAIAWWNRRAATTAPALLEALKSVRLALVEHGDGTCGYNCEAMYDQRVYFAGEIALIDAALAPSPTP